MPEFSVMIDPRVYSLSAVKKAAYRIGDRAASLVEIAEDGRIIVGLTPKSDRVTAGELEADFLNELLDQDLRETIAEETQGVRNLLMAQAFSGFAPETDEADYRDDPLNIGRSQTQGR